MSADAATTAPGPETRGAERLDLLRAKLHRPRVTRDLVTRARLWDMLDAGLGGRLLLVSAAAGFGKTTLVSSWLEQLAAAGPGGVALPAAWLSLDAHDSELVVFLHYLVAALRTRFPEALSETLALLGAQRHVPQEHLMTMLSNEIELLGTKVIVVLDDYHLLEGQEVHEFLTALLYHWPRPLNLVLISRVDPPLPLAGLRAGDKLAEIRTGDLRFRAEEAEAYLERALEIHLRQQDAAQLEQQTEGWIAGLRLVALSLRSAGEIDGLRSTLARTGKGIADYLQEEVLARQVPAVQTFLLKTSVVDRFCPALCAAVVGEIDPAWSVRACIDWIERADLFVTPLDDRREWYRYHPLFRDFLREKLRGDLGAAGMLDLCRRAAGWYAGAGLIHEAVGLALECGDQDLAAQVIRDRLRDELNRDDRLALEHWLNLFPEEYVQKRPWLLMLKAWALSLSWQLARASKAVDQVEALIEADGGTALPAEEAQLLLGQILVLRGQHAFLDNQQARCVALCAEALELLPPSWLFVRAGAKIYWGLGMSASGRAEEAERLLLEEYESLDDKTTGYALRLLQTACFNYVNTGRLELADRTAHVLLQQATRGGKATPQGWAHMLRGLVHFLRNDLEAAGLHLAEVVDLRYQIQSLVVHQGLTLLALVLQARGDNDAASRVAEMLAGFQLEQGGREDDEVRSLRARLMLARGDREGASRWANAFTAPVPDRALLWAEIPHLTRARILLARNRGDDAQVALRIADDLLDVAVRTHNARCRIQFLAVRALALDAVGQPEQALADLQAAVDLARPGGFVRPFVDLGPAMDGLLGRLAEGAPAAEPLARILAAFPGAGPGSAATPATAGRTADPAPGVRPLVEPLTPRELQILSLLREPVWPKEIARQLGISYLTVKRHTANLYGKLGVKTRWEAVSRAVELDILPPR